MTHIIVVINILIIKRYSNFDIKQTKLALLFLLVYAFTNYKIVGERRSNSGYDFSKKS